MVILIGWIVFIPLEKEKKQLESHKEVWENKDFL